MLLSVKVSHKTVLTPLEGLQIKYGLLSPASLETYPSSLQKNSTTAINSEADTYTLCASEIFQLDPQEHRKSLTRSGIRTSR